MTRRVTIVDADGTVEADVGDTVEVVLPETPSNGFVWASQTQAPALRLMTEDRAHASRVPGAEGAHHFIFRVESVGQTDLRFALARPWEKAEPAATFRVSVTAS